MEALPKAVNIPLALVDQGKLSAGLFTYTIPTDDLTLSIFSVKPHMTENSEISSYVLAGV